MDAGYAIKFCRQQKKLSIPALAKRAMLSSSYVSLLERNERDPPLSTLKKICTALGVPLNVLVFVGTTPSELESLTPDITEKLAAATMKLLHAAATDEPQSSFL